MAILPSTALGASPTKWTGTTSSDWYTVGNWSNGVPDSTQLTTFDSNGPNAPVIDGGTAVSGQLNMAIGTTTLTIQNAGVLASTSSTIGFDFGSDATVIVKGGSSWNVGAGLIRVGDDGTGALKISGASTVSDLNAIVGQNADSSGTVTVDGAGSSWSTGKVLTVGQSGAGALTVSGGATVTDQDAVVGEIISGTGDVTVDGAGSAWQTARAMTIGDYGVGTLTVKNAGTVHNGENSFIGNHSSGNGTVTVTGAGSTMTDDAELHVGDQGHGTLNILAGGVVNDNASMIGFNPQSVGDATVDGTGSQWTITNSLNVGVAGTGTLTISNGGKVTDHDAVIGQTVGSVGTVIVTGAGSTWTNTGALDVAYDATGTGSYDGGTLNVLKGGAVSVGVLTVAGDTGSQGQVLIDGAGSTLTSTGDAYVGRLGYGLTTISAGGYLNDARGFIGDAKNSRGEVEVNDSGSQYNNSGDLTVGSAGTGWLGIHTGGAVTDVGGFVATLAGSGGVVVVDGPGSTWVNTGILQIGGSGTGYLTITNGGAVSAGNTTIGLNVSGVGNVAVAGAGSSLDLHAHDLEVGAYSTGAGGGPGGTLIISDGGAVDALNTYIGEGANSTGVLAIDGPNSVLNNGATTKVGIDGTGTLSLTDGGTLASTDIYVGQGTGSGKIVIGGDLFPYKAGYITAFGGSGAHSVTLGGSGELDFNHTSSNYVFDAMLGGNGTIYQKAGTTVLTGNSGATGGNYTGNAYVDAGKLIVNGDLSNGSVIVGSGGTLGGNGQIQNLTAHLGSIIAPGNSIGTLQVSNTVQFDTGSTYQVEVNPAASDQIVTGGVATISGGTVEALAAPGQYAASTQYTILTATGGVAGQYSGVTVDSPFLTASLSKDADDVYLTLTRINANLFQSAGQTPNEQATGAGLDSAAVGNAAANALFALGSSAQASGLDQLSGEIHASLKGAMLDDSRYVREVVTDRLRRSLGGDDAGSGLWTSAFGSVGIVNADGNAAELDSSAGGIFVGADGMVADGFRLGVLGGYTHGAFDASARNSTASTDSLNAAIYSGFETGGFGLRLGADYAVHAIHTNRSVSFTGFSDTDQAAYGAQTGQVFGELGYKMQVGSASFEPFAAAAYVRQSTDGFTEAGGSSALTGQSDVVAATFTTLGLRVASTFELGTTKGTLRGSLGWRHAFGDLTPTSTMSFANGDPFTISGVPLAADAAVLDAGIDLTLAKDVTFGASYSGQLSKSGFDNGAKANLNWQF